MESTKSRSVRGIYSFAATFSVASFYFQELYTFLEPGRDPVQLVR